MLSLKFQKNFILTRQKMNRSFSKIPLGSVTEKNCVRNFKMKQLLLYKMIKIEIVVGKAIQNGHGRLLTGKPVRLSPPPGRSIRLVYYFANWASIMSCNFICTFRSSVPSEKNPASCYFCPPCNGYWTN